MQESDPLGLPSIEKFWSLYFPFDDFDPSSPWVDATRLFRHFFLLSENGQSLLAHVNLNETSQVVFDYTRFVSLLTPELHAFEEVLKANAEIMIACLGLALCSLRSSG
jgi:hypothetical protein